MTARFWFAEKKNVSLMNKFDFKCKWKKNTDEIYEGWWTTWFLTELIVYKSVEISEKIINIQLNQWSASIVSNKRNFIKRSMSNLYSKVSIDLGWGQNMQIIFYPKFIDIIKLIWL